MAVHSICCVRYKSVVNSGGDNFCLSVVGMFRNCVSFFCTHLASDCVGSFLGAFICSKKLSKDKALRGSLWVSESA
ncbi:hypothetical protein ATI02_6382 [Pseudomonas baetica]|uniref:Uncharacterized protein n=1 Tax=Pseudomonas baetica TaxID=674054 RepID=A0ABX4Q8Y3_9PSED|nr:hypothetical protein ATI02_6382 [Pseudomonas baetica]